MPKLSSGASHMLRDFQTAYNDELVKVNAAVDAAEEAQEAAEEAQGAAEEAQGAAESAKDDALIAQGAAELAALQAQGVFDANIEQIRQAMSGDMVLVISPATCQREETSEAWEREVTITLKDSEGEVHSWFNRTFVAPCTIADDSALGTASLENNDQSLEFVNGVATKKIIGSAHAWIAAETNTLTIATLPILGKEVAGGTSVETIIEGE